MHPPLLLVALVPLLHDREEASEAANTVVPQPPPFEAVENRRSSAGDTANGRGLKLFRGLLYTYNTHICTM